MALIFAGHKAPQRAFLALSLRVAGSDLLISTKQPSLAFPNIRREPQAHRRWQSSSAVRINHNEKVNAPVSTLPVPLVLPDFAPDEQAISRLFKTGKAYGSFYYAGLKNVYHNFRAAAQLHRDLSQKGHGSISDAIRAGALDRSGFQLLRRNSHDISRIPLFGLLFLVCGEFTPFVVPFVSAIVPWTCRLPSQIRQDRTRLEDRRKQSFRNLVLDPKDLGDAGLEGLSGSQLLHVSRSLGIHSKWWPEANGLPPASLLKYRVGKRIEYLDRDDELISKDGGVQQMEMEEVRMALVDRGLDTTGKNDEQQREALLNWLSARKANPTTKLLLTRYAP
ncbi:MAG: hypothetical protein M1825_000084 [Sarcosagium campestre]|nr:MAG: hypothetical protein M1825_000084 [Sarcosagium campestre]